MSRCHSSTVSKNSQCICLKLAFADEVSRYVAYNSELHTKMIKAPGDGTISSEWILSSMLNILYVRIYLFVPQPHICRGTSVDPISLGSIMRERTGQYRSNIITNGSKTNGAQYSYECTNVCHRLK